MNFSKLLRTRAEQLEASIANATNLKLDGPVIMKPATVKAFVAIAIYREIADMFDATIEECEGLEPDANDSIPEGTIVEIQSGLICEK